MCVMWSGELKTAGLLLEGAPISSIYLGGRLGRPAVETKNHYVQQSSLTLIPHTTADFISHGGGVHTGRRAIKPPRLEPPCPPELEAVGVIVSAKHPDSGTFLAPAVADHVIKRSSKQFRRFSDPGDMCW
ncbi:unnamed protein product [Discosporangium mesarthrocarpum]